MNYMYILMQYAHKTYIKHFLKDENDSNGSLMGFFIY